MKKDFQYACAQGLTLIELLIVIAIISILASLAALSFMR
ncbi:MAG: prepilin-type N-terminal cleavage/methylation domain-containing protein [Gammaproteobacteria bacterium]|nr:prepilin-type N-terminal cleavage/methylation domain-containing protein [Gammaproteobacteria bacterium]